jgi:hypothetical protein
MKSTLSQFIFAAFVLTGTMLFAPDASAQTDPRYFVAMRAELQAMGITGQCMAVNAQVGACRAVASPVPPPGTTPSPVARRRYSIALEYNDQTDTVYIYLDRYATLRGDATNAAPVFRRFAEMNWEMLVGKFEWSSTTGEVRLSAVMHTDSNFDRRAFRGTVRALLRLADRYAEEVSHLTGSPVGEAPEAAGQPSTPAAAPGAALTPIAHP